MHLDLTMIDKSAAVGGCWLWTDRVNDSGYGIVSIRSEETRVHKRAWEEASGTPVPAGRIVCHTCDVRTCCRNDVAGVYVVDDIEYPRFGHLWLGTRYANMRDMIAKGRHRPGRLPGERHHQARLTEAQVLDIRARYAAGNVSQPALARMFGVALGTINFILQRQTWRHI
jgi:hypothetical protein